MISVTVEKYVGSQWKLTPEPSTHHIINMIDDALREYDAFDTVVPQGDFIVGYNRDSESLSNKQVKKIRKAVQSAALVLGRTHKPKITFKMGN